MEVTLPVFVNSEPVHGEKELTFSAQLLFEPKIQGQDTSLQRAMQKLNRRTRVELDHLGRAWDHSMLAKISLNPEIQTQRLKLNLDLKSSQARFIVFLVIVKLGDRLVAFSPHLRDVWFQIDSLARLEQRAAEVYQQFFIKTENDANDRKKLVEMRSLHGQAWISSIDIDVPLNQKSPQDNVRELMALWDEDQLDGGQELQKVGRCLDWLYPDELQRALGRENDAAELERLLELPDRRSILIVGPHLVGKTNLIHEVVFRRLEKRQKKHRINKNTWLLSPQRLISGMMYVGQWENRLLAILDESRKRKHILYFDDLLGLFNAGKSRDSDLCVADLLRNAIQSRSVRVIAEITPEAHEILNQTDRSFADLFHVHRMQPIGQDQMFKLLVEAQASEEVQHRCWFNLDVLPKIVDLTERYQRTAAFPGKAVRILKQLAVRRSRHNISLEDVYANFANTTGLSLRLVKDDTQIRRDDILAAMHARIVGQEDAIDACADVVAIAKARLNDPVRPLATLLFLGPTGVGKTETAKALTDFLFESREALIRFDLNQFKSSYSASLLVGTPDRPEGLLTQSIRQRPFCVLLLDEVEKAHPDVLEVLLQVLGEGRLTDAHGRTTDFTNCIIIMTSNLGTGTATRQIGYAANESSSRYVAAARNFFKPEFFNRIDRIIPFHPLSVEQVRHIADGLMRDVVAREGLARRSCVLQVEPAALHSIAQKGFHPELGARAMRRAIEQEFVAPVSRRLAEIVSDSPTVISASADSGQLHVQVEPLENELPVSHWNIEPDPHQTAVAANEFVNRIRNTFLATRPSGEITSDGISPDLLHYYAVDEQLNQFIARVKDFELTLESIETKAAVPQIRTSFRNTGNDIDDLRRLLAADDIDAYIAEVSFDDDPGGKKTVNAAQKLQSEAALLDLIVSGDANEHCWFVIKMDGRETLRGSGLIIRKLTMAYMALFKNTLGFEVSLQSVSPSNQHGSLIAAMEVAGPAAFAVASREASPNLYFDHAGRMLLLQTAILPNDWVINGEITSGLQKAFQVRFSNPAGNGPTGTNLDNPFKIDPMCRVYHSSGKTIDFRTKQTLEKWPDAAQLYDLLIGGLERPPEFAHAIQPIDKKT